MDKILFIVPPHIEFDSYKNPYYNARVMHKKSGDFGSLLTDMPLGILSISAYVKKHVKVKTKLIDFNVVLNKLDSFDFIDFKEFFEKYLLSDEFRKYKPSIIGISALFTPSYQNTLEIACICKKIFPKAILVAGGGVPTNMYSEIFQKGKMFDGLCFGEGEKPFLKLIKSKNKYRFLEKNSSWITHKKVENKEKYLFDFVENLDDIPFFDYGMCEKIGYGLNPAITAYAGVDRKKTNFHVMTSRGCPNHCCFCASHTVHGRSMRYYSLARVYSDLKRLRDRYGAETFVFQDDHLMANRERALSIINFVKKLKVKAVFQNGLALYALDREVLEAIKNAGVNQLMLSVESGSERVLRELMHKPLDLTIVKQVASDCRELGIYTNANILIGLPGETKKDILDARRFLKTINANWFMIFCASPLVGSEMRDICIKKGYLKGNDIGSDYKKAVVETNDFTAKYVQNMSYTLNLELNFVYNSDMRLGEYETALKGFENAIRAKNDHVFAYYYASLCYKKLGDLKKSKVFLNKAKSLLNKSSFWQKYARMFKISI